MTSLAAPFNEGAYTRFHVIYEAAQGFGKQEIQPTPLIGGLPRSPVAAWQ